MSRTGWIKSTKSNSAMAACNMHPRHTISMTESQLRELMRETVHATLSSLGFTTDAPHQIQADMMYLRKARLGSDEVAKWVRRTTISVGVSGLLFALFEGIKLGIK